MGVHKYRLLDAKTQAKIDAMIKEELDKDLAQHVADRLSGKGHLRRTGRTTRIVDQAIQTLFQHGKVRFSDHHGTYDSTDHAVGILVKRMHSEHPHVQFEIIRVAQHDVLVRLKNL